MPGLHQAHPTQNLSTRLEHSIPSIPLWFLLLFRVLPPHRCLHSTAKKHPPFSLTGWCVHSSCCLSQLQKLQEAKAPSVLFVADVPMSRVMSDSKENSKLIEWMTQSGTFSRMGVQWSHTRGRNSVGWRLNRGLSLETTESTVLGSGLYEWGANSKWLRG